MSGLEAAGCARVAGYKAAAAEFNAWGETCAAAGLKLYQHNHTDEFRVATDQPSVRVYDVWIGETDPRFVHLEMDIYWAEAAKNLFPGFEPLNYVQAQPHRYSAPPISSASAPGSLLSPRGRRRRSRRVA